MISQTLINFIQPTAYAGDGAVWDIFDKFWTALLETMFKQKHKNALDGY